MNYPLSLLLGCLARHYTAEFQERQMDLGIALDIEELLTLDSRMVGGSVAEVLIKRHGCEAEGPDAMLGGLHLSLFWLT